MRLIGFTTPEAMAIADQLLDDDTYKFHDNRAITESQDCLKYSLPGLPLCWKCTVKHVGQAVGFAAEVESYPERIACVIGELGHAYRECPSKELSDKIRLVYTGILDTGCVPDLTPLLSTIVEAWQRNLNDAL